MTLFEFERINSVGSDEGKMAEGMIEVLQRYRNQMPSNCELECAADETNSGTDEVEPLETELPLHEEDGRSEIQKEAAKMFEAMKSLGEALQKALAPNVAPMPREIGPAAPPTVQDGDPQKSDPIVGPKPSKPIDDASPAKPPVEPIPNRPTPEIAPPPRRVEKSETEVASLEFGDVWSAPIA